MPVHAILEKYPGAAADVTNDDDNITIPHGIVKCFSLFDGMIADIAFKKTLRVELKLVESHHMYATINFLQITDEPPMPGVTPHANSPHVSFIRNSYDETTIHGLLWTASFLGVESVLTTIAFCYAKIWLHGKSTAEMRTIMGVDDDFGDESARYEMDSRATARQWRIDENARRK